MAPGDYLSPEYVNQFNILRVVKPEFVLIANSERGSNEERAQYADEGEEDLEDAGGTGEERLLVRVIGRA